jgi:uncharacterized protein
VSSEPKAALLVELGAAVLVSILASPTTDAQHTEAPSKTAMSSNPATPTHRNRLASEKSPYLLQHQHNPVDWYPWGEEAFAKAKGENKPIFLSIGYSTCHWCHVMERESFEDTNTAQFLNEHFVSIKVDREERPDVDKIYMSFVQAMSGQGGWPLSVFLTPERKPFYGGTYFPPENRYGHPGFLQVLTNISDVWQSRRQDVSNSARQLHEQLGSALQQTTASDLVLTPALLKNAATQFKDEFDPHHGGFGGAPKFPRPSQPAFLLSYGVRHGDTEAVTMVARTCEAMAAGGMHDQLGGGFHRYSVEAEWLVPHFEKMLYDNAQLINLYLDVSLVTGQTEFANVARDVLGYVLRDMTHPEGGFYSAEDADSEGKEGKFYCWTKAELGKLLMPEEFNVAVSYFGITDAGNFVDHSDPDPLPHQNVLHVAQPHIPASDQPLLTSARAKMLHARSARVRPRLDDKTLASWNGMMLGAMARAYAVLGDPSYLAAAEKNLRFLQSKLWDEKSKTLYHRWRDGERDAVQLLDAYANLLAGVIDLYEATLNPEHLRFALDLSETMLAKFYDPEHGGFWQSAATSSELILRVKDDYDGAEPSGNSVAVLALLKLAAITDRKDLRTTAEKTLRLFAERLERLPQAVPHLLIGLDFFLEDPRRVVIAGDPQDPPTGVLLRAAHSIYKPHKVVLGTAGPVEPFAQTLVAKGASATAYVCTGTACQPPANDPESVRRALRR